MKSIVLFYLLFIFTFSVASVFSYTSHKARLYNLLSRPMNKKADPILLTVRNKQNTSKSGMISQLSSAGEDDNIQPRTNWDSGEDYYFQWAKQNRRPVEYLAGRKRETNTAILAARARRINGGLWRSGLVG